MFDETLPFNTFDDEEEYTTLNLSGKLSAGLRAPIESEVASMAPDVGVAPGALRAMTPEDRRQIRNDNNIFKIPEDSATRRYLSNPSNFAVSQDEATTLQSIEEYADAGNKMIQNTFEAILLAPMSIPLSFEADMLVSASGRRASREAFADTEVADMPSEKIRELIAEREETISRTGMTTSGAVSQDAPTGFVDPGTQAMNQSAENVKYRDSYLEELNAALNIATKRESMPEDERIAAEAQRQKDIAREKVRLQTLQDAQNLLGYNDNWASAAVMSGSGLFGQQYERFMNGETGSLLIQGAVAGAAVAIGMKLLPAYALFGPMSFGIAGKTVTVAPWLATTLTGAFTGMRMGSMVDTFEAYSGQMYQELRELRDAEGNPLPDDIIRKGSAIAGIVTAALDGSLGWVADRMLMQITPIKAAQKEAARRLIVNSTGAIMMTSSGRAAIREAAKNITLGTVSQTSNEIMQEAVLIFTREAAKRKAASAGLNYFIDTDGASAYFGLFSEEAQQRYKDIAYKMALGSFAMGLPMASVSVASNLGKAQQAKAYANDVGEVHNKLHTEAPTTAASPTHAQRFLNITGFNQEVYIASTDLIEIAEAHPEVAEALDITESDITAAREEARPTAFSMSELMSKLKPGEAFDSIKNKIYVNLDGMNAEDAAATKANMEETMGRYVNTVNEINSELSDFNEGMKEVTAAVESVSKAKGWEASYAQDVAQVIESFAFRMGVTEGLNPAEFLSRLDVQDMANQIGDTGQAGLEQAAFHGTPHTLTPEPGFPHGRFRLDKIGTGEGAQAFGWGIYFAESESVGRWYYGKFKKQDFVNVVKVADPDPGMVSFPAYRVGGRTITIRDGVPYWAADRASKYGRKGAIKRLEIDARYENNKEKKQEFLGAVEFLKSLTNESRPSLYKMDIPDSAMSKLLDLDKPMSDQNDYVKSAADKFLADVKENNAEDILQDYLDRKNVDSIYDLTGREFQQQILQRAIQDDIVSPTEATYEKSMAPSEAASDYLLNFLGVPGNQFLDGSSRGSRKGEGTHNYVIWDQNVLNEISLLERNQKPLQALEQARQAEVRGRMTPVADNKYLIEIFRAANKSTVFHELGHVFLSEMRFIQEQNETSNKFNRDMKAIEKWLKTGERPEGMSKQVFEQEKFARGFEQYLMDGTAPSTELQGAFERIRAWMKSVYATVQSLVAEAGFSIDMNTDVREIFDRMLATDAQIDHAAMDIDFVLTPENIKDLNLTKAEKEQLRTTLNAARKNAKIQMQYEKDRHNKARIAQWKKDAQDVISNNKFYVHREQLTETPIDYAMLKEVVGKDKAEQFMRSRSKMVKTGSGYSPAQAAADLGYQTVDDMVTSQVNTPSKVDFIKDYVTNERESWESSNLSAEETIMTQKKTDEYLEAVGKIIARQANLSRESKSARALKQWATARVWDKTTNKAMQSDQYARRSRQAMKQFQKLLRSTRPDKFMDALNALESARQYSALAQQAKQVKKEIRSAEKRVTKYVNPKDKPTIAYGRMVKHILKQMGLHKSKVDYTENLLSLDALFKQNNEESPIPRLAPHIEQSTLDKMKNNYRKNLTANEARQVFAFLDWLQEEGKAIAEGKLSHFTDNLPTMVAKFMARINELTPLDMPPAEGTVARSLWKTAMKGNAHKTKMQFYFNMLDGSPQGRVLGPQTTLIWGELDKANARVVDRMEAATNKILEYSEPLHERAGQFPAVIAEGTVQTNSIGDQVIIPPVPNLMARANMRWTFNRIVVMALYQGNPYNQQAILDGYGMTQPQVDTLVSLLNDQDWEAVYGIREVIDAQWESQKKAYEALNRFTPPRVDGVDYTNSVTGKTHKGGYFPISFDGELSELVGKRKQFDDLMSSTVGAIFNPKMHDSQMRARTGTAGLPVSLDLGDVARAVAKAITYSEMSPLVHDIHKITSDKDYRAAAIDKFGRDEYNQILPWLQSINNNGADDNPATAYYVRQVKAMISADYLAGKVTVAAKQPASFIAFADRWGWVDAVRGLMSYHFGAGKGAKFERAITMSTMMKNRVSDIDDSMAYLMSIGVKRESKFSRATRTISGKIFKGSIGVFDSLVSFPEWNMAFEEAMENQKMSPEDAATYANTWVSMYNPTTRTMDKSYYQRQVTTLWAFTNLFSGWTETHYNHMKQEIWGGAKGVRTPQDVLRFTLINAVVAPAAMTLLISGMRGRTPDWKEVAADVVGYNMAGIPFLGTLVGMGARRLAGLRAFELESPIISFVNRLGNLALDGVSDLADGEVRKALWGLAELLSAAYRIPAARLYSDLQEGWDQWTSGGQATQLLFPDPQQRRR